MIKHTAESFKQNGRFQIVLGVLSIIWQVGISVSSSQEDIYQGHQGYARDISNSSTGFISGFVFIISGLFSCKCCNMINDPARGDPTKNITVSKALDWASIAVAILMEIFNGYLAYLTSHWYKEENLNTAKLAHAALPFHVLETITGIIEIIVAIMDLRVKPITKPLPPVTYTPKPSGLENPAYASSRDPI
ncbi:hypothetical protein BV898_15486 [Hypsibius exemplaris]|uniref:Uncharacterized protein n=1 Tax=Hypsibius exemplaris TaxID=2072580 RepID=A0A9X6NB37_HYPEX|nr:hypothetical protein BV898_15486 [Hypsibius exemplaris]